MLAEMITPIQPYIVIDFEGHLEDFKRKYPIKKVKPRKKISRNNPCPCGSGKKIKNCCPF